MLTKKECAICGQGIFGGQVKVGACAGKCAEQWAADVVDTITRMAVDDTARVMMREGFRLDAETYEALGDDQRNWAETRLGLEVEYESDAYYVGTPR